MLFTLISALLIIPVLVGWGKLLEISFGKGISGISGSFFSGLMVIGLGFTLISFFYPLNIYIEVPVLLIGFLFFFKKKSYQEIRNRSKKDVLIFIIAVFCILFFSSFYPFILDHFGYYVPTVSWLQEYGLVKGIANLDLTLGQMSTWHIIQAGFSNFSDPFLKLNAILLIAYTFYSIENKSWIQLIFVPALLIFSHSPSPDLPTIVFSLVILSEIFSGARNWAFLFAFAVFTFSIKPTVIWLPLFVFLWALSETKSLKHCFFAASILMLFGLKNIWTFGFPVFPVSSPDLGVSWKPNADILKTSSEFALIKTYDEKFTYSEISKFSWLDYIKNWLFVGGIKSVLNISIIVSLLLFSLITLTKKQKILNLLCISLLFKAFVILAFSAQYRFLIDLFFVVCFVLFFKYCSKKTAVWVSASLMLLCGVFFLIPDLFKKTIPSFKLGEFMTEFKAKQLIKPAVYQYKEYNHFKVGKLKFNVSKTYPFNFDTPLPAISEGYIFDDYKAGIFPHPIDDNDYSKGFIWKKLNAEEQKELQKVIDVIKNNYP